MSRFDSINKFDTFTPNIPDAEEPATTLTAPSDSLSSSPTSPTGDTDDSVSNVGKNIATKKSKRTSTQKPIQKKSNGIFTSIKNWGHSQTVRWISGLFVGFFGVYLGLSFLSYLSTCIADQSEIANTAVGFAGNISNSGGEGGARLSEFLINNCFGCGSFVIIFWLLSMSVKLLTGRPKFKTVDFAIKSMIALITVSLIAGLLTISLDTPVNWGGFHGRYVNEFIIHFIGWTGAWLLCLFMVCLFVIICMHDLVAWIIRMKRTHDEKRKLAAELKAAELAKQMDIEKMREAEENAPDISVNDGENESADNESGMTQDFQNSPLSFADEDNSYYYALPDFDDIEGGNHENKDIEPSEDVPYTLNDDSYSLMSDTHEANGEFTDGYALNEKNNDSPQYAPEQSNDIPDTSEDTIVVNVNEISQADSKQTSSAEHNSWTHPYKFPSPELLREGDGKINVNADEVQANKERIKKTLLDFGIPIVSITATVGPTVTLYKIIPERGVKINKIRNLVDDIALRIAAVGVRIIAPIPGEGTVGIEVANDAPQTVSMRTIINSNIYRNTKFKLPIAIGATISNDVYITDLTKMPHLLVAGATGQGKSVGLNAIIASLLYSKTPDQLKFVMVDPKMVEFSLYAKIEKHYLAKIPDAVKPIITDMEKVVSTLNSLVIEMEERYHLLMEAHTRNIEEYNEKIKQKLLNPAEGHRFLPYIVVIVDEFSDLIMTAGKEIEIPIARLAQKARAIGIHVIIATQRPSANVITGVIKANFPARMAFKVSSGIDSKTILDTTGAQQLIGRGDMLVSNPPPLVRVQCAFIDTPEVESICDYIERQPYPQGAYMLPEPPASGSDKESAGTAVMGEKDPLYDEVARLIVNSNTASTSSIQRRYSIGYNRAGKIMDQLEAAGIVGPATGGKPRSVLVDAATLESILNA